MVAIASFAVGASPLLNGRSPFDALSPQLSLLHPALIYAKDGSSKLVDGRWNLSQSESKLGVKLSAEQTQQLMACTGQIVCKTPDVHTEDEDRIGVDVTATAVSVLRPDLLVTAKHVIFKGKNAVVSFGSCSFRSFSRRKVAIPIIVEKDQRKGYRFNNEDFIVLRLKRALEGCNGFALNDSDSSLREGERVLSVTARQRRMLNKISGREPVVATGKVRRVLDGVLGGPPFYYADVDFDVGGSGGAVFALTDRRPEFPHAADAQAAPVSDDQGRLVLRGISVAYGPKAKNGKPYSDGRNYTIVIGLQAEFRDLVEGKAHRPAAVEPAPCLEGGTPKITVISDSVPPTQSETLVPLLQRYACNRQAAANCSAHAEGLNLGAWWQQQKPRRVKQKRAKPIPAKQKHEFALKNDTSCRICFTYHRCNDYGCWDQAVRLSAKSSLAAGTAEQAPAIKNPQFCN
jgi:hypothetical protein